jgi:iron(III) transport system substrate-binding protein
MNADRPSQLVGAHGVRPRLPNHEADQPLSRRNFLRLISLGAGAGLLAACRPAPTAPAPTAATKQAAPAAKPAAADKPAVKLGTLDQELAVPAAWLDAANKEAKFVLITSTDKEVSGKIAEAFKMRYPGIEPQVEEGSEEVRTVRTLTEFKAGRNRMDIIQGVGGFMKEYKEAKAPTPLNDLPAIANYEPPWRDTEFGWTGVRTQVWGIGYNTDKVKAADLPKTWEDLTQPKWKGRIGLGDRPQLWAQQLWKVWGPERTTEFLKQLFANDPQRRKEGLDASANLLGLGEYDLLVPAAPYRIQEYKGKGSPVGWFSPEPISIAVSEMIIMNGALNPNAAKVFVNWFISREGQSTYAKAENSVPAHPALRTERDYLGEFADSFVGRPASYRTPEDEINVLPEVRKVWQPLWIG